MSTIPFDRSDFYCQLGKIEVRLADAIKHRLLVSGSYTSPHANQHRGHWFLTRRYGVRAANVKKALDESEGIALRSLKAKLGSISLEAIWPVLRLVCHDVALYLGGGALSGAVVGGGLGMLAFGVGAIPGAVAGSVIGIKIGSMLVGFLGLKSVVEYMIASIPLAAEAYQDGFMEAWGRVPNLSQNSFDCPHYGSDFALPITHNAARAFARGHEILVVALLTGIVTYLTRGRGNLTALLSEARHSARLGPKIANWLEQNADKLRGHPLLQVRNKGGGGAIAQSADHAPTSKQPFDIATSAGGSTASNALRQGGLRNLTQLVGKSEGGPGAWQLSPMRSKGEAYQEQITGAQRGIEYDVALIGAKGEKVRFDGYDASRKVLLDAKDWKGFPPKDTVFWTENVLKEAKSQLEAAKGVPIEWHFSTQSGRDAVLGLFRDRDITGITLVVTSGH